MPTKIEIDHVGVRLEYYDPGKAPEVMNMVITDGLGSPIIAVDIEKWKAEKLMAESEFTVT